MADRPDGLAAAQEAPIWTRHEYWGGAWPEAPSTFDAPKRPAGPYNAAQHAAAHVLATSLEGVIQGDYEQSEASAWGGFSPDAMDLEDGTVVLLERERLSKMSYHAGWAEPLNEQLGDLPQEIEDFAEYWRTNHDNTTPLGHAEKKSFGTKGGELSYQRSLQWGVVVPHLGNKAVFTWEPEDFDHAFSVRDGIVSFRPEMGDLSLLPTPISLGKAEASRKGRKNIVIPRSIERTTGVRIIEAEGKADYQEACENADIFSTLQVKLSDHAAALSRGAELIVVGYLSKN